MMLVRVFAFACGAMVLLGDVALAYQYKSVRGLYRECAAGVGGGTAEARTKSKRCADYLDHAFDGWLLSQRSDVCSKLRRSDLPRAYVEYWTDKGLGLASRYRAPSASVHEFLDSHARRCSTLKAKAAPLNQAR